MMMDLLRCSVVKKCLYCVISVVLIANIFLNKYAFAGSLISQEELYGDFGGSGEISMVGVMILFFVTFSFPIGYYIFGKIKKTKIDNENKQNFNKFIDKLFDNARTRGLAQKIKVYSYTKLLLAAEDWYVFYSLDKAQEKAKEINKNERVAFIWKEQQEYSGVWGENYTVFVFNYESN